MKITFKMIDRSNYEACINLKISEEQKKYVAPNMLSLVQAAYEPDMYPLGIYVNETIVGFILYDFDTDINGWSMSRFMIDLRYQNRGYGKESLKAFLNYFRAKYGNVSLYTSAEVENKQAIKLYNSFGFSCLNEFEYEIEDVKHREVRMVLEEVK